MLIPTKSTRGNFFSSSQIFMEILPFYGHCLTIQGESKVVQLLCSHLLTLEFISSLFQCQTGSPHTTHAGHKLHILLPPLSMCWDLQEQTNHTWHSRSLRKKYAMLISLRLSAIQQKHLYDVGKNNREIQSSMDLKC